MKALAWKEDVLALLDEHIKNHEGLVVRVLKAICFDLLLIDKVDLLGAPCTPTKPGWYWAKEKKSTWKNIIELTPSEIKDKAFHQAALRYPFKAFTFYGPLPEPEGW